MVTWYLLAFFKRSAQILYKRRHEEICMSLHVSSAAFKNTRANLILLLSRGGA